MRSTGWRDPVRDWFDAYQRNGLTGLSEFGHEGSACRLTDEQQTALKAWVAAHLPRSTNMIGAWLKETLGLDYSDAGLMLGLECCKPRRIPRHLDEARQQAFIDKYEKLLNGWTPMNRWCSSMRCIRPIRCARPAAGRRKAPRLRSSRPPAARA